jgi:pimeloyl-ACP methyl ester carboxylesterase
VAIHGAVANAATWIPLQRALGDDADVLAFDLPGHGTRRAEAFDLEAAIGALTAMVVAEAALRPTVVAGDSLGGYLALGVAARAGYAVRGVIGGSCTFPMRGVAAAFARATLVLDPLVPAGAIAAVIAHACAPDVAEAIRERGLAPAMRGATLRALLGRDVMRDVAGIVSPIVFISGAFDIPIAWYANTFARAARDGRAVSVPRATHGVGLSHPEAFAAAARALFAGGV